MMHDDDLDRALAALPLDEPPARLRARIIAATVNAPPVAMPFRAWELWLVGVAAALAVWCSMLVLAEPNVGQRFADGLASVVASTQTWLWFAIGAAAALSVWAFTVPSPPRVRSR